MTLNLPAIIAEISSALGINFHVLAGPLKGGSNCVYEIKSEDGEYRWCLRIPLGAEAASYGSRGIAIMRDVKKSLPDLQIPAVIYQSNHCLVMEYLKGHVLGSWNTHSLAKERRRLLLDDLAVFLYSLWTLGTDQLSQVTGIFE
jgi:Ser/Thr protein kinase RdoA (MazF antagonist)